MNVSEMGQTQPPQSNGNPEAELASLVHGLQAECERLRQALAQMETERDLYLKALYANARKSLHFEAGPVEITE